MNKWWGVIFKDKRIELKEFVDGDNAKIRFAYMNEAEIDFVIEPFNAESFDDAKVWVTELLQSSVINSTMIIFDCIEGTKIP